MADKYDEEIRKELKATGPGEAAEEFLETKGMAPAAVGPLREILQRFRKNRMAFAAAILLVVFYTVMLLSFIPRDFGKGAWYGRIIPRVVPRNPYTIDYDEMQEPPHRGGKYVLGGDENGRDEISRLIVGSEVSLTLGVVAMLMALLVGVLVGAVAGFYGGIVDAILMRMVDFMLSLPLLPLVLILAVYFGTTFVTITGLIALFSWMTVARLVRGQFMSLRHKEFVEAARAAGASDLRIMTRHLLTNSWAPIIVAGTLGVANAITFEAWLSFLGFGIQQPRPTWGNMLSNAQDFLFTAPYLLWFPGLAIFITVLCFNFVGDGLRDALDPYLRE